MSAASPDDVVRLATAQKPVQAHVWEQALREAGIKCKVVRAYDDAGALLAEVGLDQLAQRSEDLADLLPGEAGRVGQFLVDLRLRRCFRLGFRHGCPLAKRHLE